MGTGTAGIPAGLGVCWGHLLGVNLSVTVALCHTYVNLSTICELFTYLQHTHTHTHTTILLLFWNMSGTTRVSSYQKGKTRKVKTNPDFLEQEIVSGSGICWAICKSAPHPRQPRQHPTTQLLQAGCPSCHPTNSIKASSSNFFNEQKVAITAI